MPFDFVIPTSTVETASGNITVRGISLGDLSLAMQMGHGADLVRLLDEPSPDFGELINQAPRLVADLIAIAADEPDAGDTVARWPVGVQTRVITEVWTLTTQDFDMGNLWRLLAQMILSARQAIQENSAS